MRKYKIGLKEESRGKGGKSTGQAISSLDILSEKRDYLTKMI
jgi:hypothetical protein